jgi:hypothetical protein
LKSPIEISAPTPLKPLKFVNPVKPGEIYLKTLIGMKCL